ncbi:hypothetical protein G3465_12320 [Shewanella baltica]|uniref:hypothetical protein n=1 Tax=Shewanella baltica TaxID=62322 RepID=UPI00217D5935|nr:hypothetical protein [Shewanella baltica]MCS6153679.1 hypothetical protein [Shewanella baltica]
MGLPVTVYRSTDVGAPVGTAANPLDWITILKKCLVDGYGSKLSLGWTLEFENLATYAAVFRNNPVVGSGGYFQIASSNSSNGLNVAIDLSVAKGMTGVNAYVDKILQRRLSLYNDRTNGWVVLGTSRGFWMLQNSSQDTWSTTTGYSISCWSVFVGDIETFDPNDTSPFTLVHAVTGAADSTSATYQDNLGSSSEVVAVMYPAAGGSGRYEHRVNMGVFTAGSSDPNPNGIFATNLPMVFMPAILCRGTATVPVSSIPISDNLPYYRGIIPALVLPSIQGGRGLTGFEYTFDSVLYRVVQGYRTNALWLKMEGEWYA